MKSVNETEMMACGRRIFISRDAQSGLWLFIFLVILYLKPDYQGC